MQILAAAIVALAISDPLSLVCVPACAADHEYEGPKDCIGCHRALSTDPRYAASKVWVPINVPEKWDQHDKHALAYLLLLDPDEARKELNPEATKDLDPEEAANENVFRERALEFYRDKSPEAQDRRRTKAKEMATLLGIEDVSKWKDCLSCHCDWKKDTKERPKYFRDGVSCESCHGPGKDYDQPHREIKWRTTPPDEKEKKGMVDVRNPRKRIRQCLSCHLGSVKEGKILDHKMYAAGHPPLPGFEVESFAQQMPAHWTYLEHKDDSVRTNNNIRKYLGYRELDERGIRRDEEDLRGIKSVVIGGAETLRLAIELLRAQAADPSTNGGWPEFAQFDCTMCHHDLRTESWRQASPPRGKPGRPGLRAWPGVLVELGIHHAHRGNEKAVEKSTQDFQKAWRQLHDQLTAGPFAIQREQTKLDQAYASLEELAATLADELEKRSYNRDHDAGELLRDTCVIGKRPGHDYDSARQLAWAFKTIYAAAFEKQDAIETKLDELKTALHLELPSQRKQILADQHDALEAIGNYEPKRVRALFAELGELLPAVREP